MPAITLARHLPPPLLGEIGKLGELLLPPAADRAATRDELRELLARADAALITALDGMDADLIAAAPHLKLICNIGVGYDNIDVGAARARGIVVTNTPGAMDDAVADLAFALLLAVARRIPAADAWVRDGKWTADQPAAFGMGLDVARKTLGIIGFGRIGRTVARRARGFEMQTLYCGRRADAAAEAALNARHVTQDELLAGADFVVVLVPYRPETHHLIGAAELARMKPGAVLINVARGGVVDDHALAAALAGGRLAGAGLDCVENEPHVLPALRACPNAVFSPHIGSATPSTRLNMALRALKNLATGLAGGQPPDAV